VIGIIYALAASISWGAGDFFGGFAARKLNQFQVLLLMTLGSLFVLVCFAVLWNEPIPALGDIFIAILAGISGSLGLATLYRGLSLGNAALVAPVSGVIGAIIPMFVGMFTQGLPGALQLLGFIIAILGIWLVSGTSNKDPLAAREGLILAILAGIGFGGFLTLIAHLKSDLVFTPLIFAKSASLVLAIVLIRSRQLPIPTLSDSPVALLSGFLDAGGNILFLFATQYARLDIAAILSSLYPAGTVLLSILILKEKVGLNQWLGVSACVAAIILITL